MRIFDTYVQELKYNVLKELIRNEYEHNIDDIYLDIPKMISPGPKAQLRCCIYKERAILQERIKIALGGDKSNPNVIEVIDIACDECPGGGFSVTDSCRGCIVHNCQQTCPRGAISIINKRAVIDKGKCIECGKCLEACPYSAIIKQTRPCVQSCKAGAISTDENKKAVIDNDKCVMCGACVYKCPFGAIADKSYVTDAIDLLKKAENDKDTRVYAVIAPSIVSQFKYAKIEQIVTGIKMLGFYQVVEAALGADVTLYKELHEWQEKKMLTTSCCPAFVMYIKKNFPDATKHISSSPSPMVETARMIKAGDSGAKVIFIGPCTAKKYEFKLKETKGAVDCVISFEELQAFFDARNINISELDEMFLDNASFYGRIFAKSGGISQGVSENAAKLGIEGVVTCPMSGLTECKTQLQKLKVGKADGNFLEGMACEGGCINGALCLSHTPKNIQNVDKYGKDAKEKEIDNSVRLYKMNVKSE